MRLNSHKYGYNRRLNARNLLAYRILAFEMTQTRFNWIGNMARTFPYESDGSPTWDANGNHSNENEVEQSHTEKVEKEKIR